MKKILTIFTALSLSIVGSGYASADAITLNPASTQTFEQYTLSKSDSGFSTQAFDELSANVSTQTTGNYATTTVIPWGGTGNFSVTIEWPGSAPIYASSVGQGVPITMATIVYNTTSGKQVVGKITVRSGSMTWTGKVYAIYR